MYVINLLVMMTSSLILETSLSFDVIQNLLQIIVFKPTLQTVHVHKQCQQQQLLHKPLIEKNV